MTLEGAKILFVCKEEQLAICSYLESNSGVYLFEYNDDFEVIKDEVFDNVLEILNTYTLNWQVVPHTNEDLMILLLSLLKGKNTHRCRFFLLDYIQTLNADIKNYEITSLLEILKLQSSSVFLNQKCVEHIENIIENLEKICLSNHKYAMLAE